MKNNIEKLALGTVQFGLDYGINNKNGKPAKESSLEILRHAFDRGITVFDTANYYGDAEEILGEFCSQAGIRKEIKIITKLKPNLFSERSEDIYPIILSNLEESLGRLKSDYVDGYLLHTPADIRKEKIVDALGRLKKKGMVKNIGVSIYEESDALYAASLDAVDYIQIPYNVFDQRLDRTDFFQLTAKNNKMVFARSVFLQGLLLMDNCGIPKDLAGAKRHLDAFDDIIGKYGLNRLQAALLFSFRNENIDHIVFGVDKPEHLKEIIAVIENDIEFAPCYKELKKSFNDVEKKIIMPNLWEKKV